MGLLSFLVVISVGLSFFPACFHPCFVEQLSPALSCFADVPLRTRTSLGQDWACSCGKGLSPNVFGPESPDEQEASSLPLPRGTLRATACPSVACGNSSVAACTSRRQGCTCCQPLSHFNTPGWKDLKLMVSSLTRNYTQFCTL